MVGVVGSSPIAPTKFVVQRLPCECQRTYKQPARTHALTDLPALRLAPESPGSNVLHEFLTNNRAELVQRCRAKAQRRHPSHALPPQAQQGIPEFMEQLIETFRLEGAPSGFAEHPVPGKGQPALSLVPRDKTRSAATHGEELRRHGFAIDQVVHNYGDLCQAMTELAMEQDTPITVDEFHTFNRCLDNAIADAVTAFSRAEKQFAAHEARSLLETSMHSFAAIKSGDVGLKGATSLLLEESLTGVRDLIDRAFPECDTEAHSHPR